LQDIRRYIIKKFGNSTWSETKAKIYKELKQVEEFPLKGSVPEELSEFSLLGYHQVISGQNRIIYQITDAFIYIHIIIDTRRDLKDVLAKRLLR
jgi:plasmid stabilization system protein ParE